MITKFDFRQFLKAHFFLTREHLFLAENICLEITKLYLLHYFFSYALYKCIVGIRMFDDDIFEHFLTISFDMALC